MRNGLLLIVLLAPWCTGCNAVPIIRHETRYHNPFPQLARVAILPFFNQSADPTVNQDEVALAYYNELQRIPGFEVVPPGVTQRFLEASQVEIDETTELQQLARSMGVDVLVVGSVTDFSSYYPPRMGIAVNWYAANPSFHPIPPGYGLPWGTPEEEKIPADVRRQAEFALAREQLKTQTPEMPSDLGESTVVPSAAKQPWPVPTGAQTGEGTEANTLPAPSLPLAWPDPRGFVPPAPMAVPPDAWPQPEPVMTYTQIFHGNDSDFTEKLAQYYFFRDEARLGGWQGYLQRSDDFVRFCCYLHITEMLAARGGAGETRVVWRWPFGRYLP